MVGGISGDVPELIPGPLGGVGTLDGFNIGVGVTEGDGVLFFSKCGWRDCERTCDWSASFNEDSVNKIC